MYVCDENAEQLIDCLACALSWLSCFVSDATAAANVYYAIVLLFDNLGS